MCNKIEKLHSNLNTFMETFKQWHLMEDLKMIVGTIMESCFSLLHEDIQRKALDVQIARNMIVNSIKSNNGVFDVHQVMNMIRHSFTNYDDIWRTFDKAMMMPNGPHWRRFSVPINDPNKQITSEFQKPVMLRHPTKNTVSYYDFAQAEHRDRFWSDFVGGIHDLLENIIIKLAIDKVIPDSKMNDLLIENDKWLKTHARPKIRF